MDHFGTTILGGSINVVLNVHNTGFIYHLLFTRR